MAQSTTTAAYEMNTPAHGTIAITSPVKKDEVFPTAFTITPSPTHPTDVWRKPGPPEISTFNAPILYRKIQLRTFVSVRVKVWATWKGRYDQGGLVFILPESGGDSGEGEGKGRVDVDVDGEVVGKRSKWIKTGIEFYEGNALVSTVVRDRWADWSLYPAALQVLGEGGEEGVELLIERLEKDDTFWVYVIDKEGGKLPIREVTWVLSEDGGDREVWVGVYAATPTIDGVGEAGDGKEGREELNVGFGGLEWVFRD